jgi:hypothetical protein
MLSPCGRQLVAAKVGSMPCRIDACYLHGSIMRLPDFSAWVGDYLAINFTQLVDEANFTQRVVRLVTDAGCAAIGRF